MAKRNLYKRTYLEDIKNVIPQVYFEKDFSISGMERSIYDELINSHINFCIKQSSLFNISSTTNFSAMGTVEGLSRWFVKQNNLTDITARQLNLRLFEPMGYSAKEYTTSASFKSFLETAILPKITLNSSSLAVDTSSAFADTASGTHEHLISLLGWGYFLNTSGYTTSSYSPSSYVASAFTNLYFNGEEFDTTKGIKGLSHYIWKDWKDLSGVSTSLLPQNLVPGTTTYTSGVQNRNTLETLVDVVYSNQYADRGDTYVKDAFSNYITNSTFLTSEEQAGPFSKLIKAFSYSFFDTNNSVTKLASIFDIENCPDNQLPYLSDLIGWKLYGSSPSAWRRQLRNAITLYKQKGTKEGLYNALTTVLPNTSFQSSSISEFYESYVPNLIYYLLKTETTVFSSFKSWTQDMANWYAGGYYDPSYMDTNVRYVIDTILLKAVKLFPELFYIKKFAFDLNNPEFVFYYRNRNFPIPPWEEEKFYKDCEISEELTAFLERELICLGVDAATVSEFRSFIESNTTEGSIGPKYYNNGFFFLTSSIHQPPNRDSLIDNFEVDKYDYFPLWNGKSSHFDVDVSSTTFSGTLFLSKDFLKDDFLQSLAVVDDFSPAKSIPRVRVNLDALDSISLHEYTCPSVRYWMYDTPVSGMQSGAWDQGVDITKVPGTMGSSYTPPANSSRATVDHTYKPVFDRSFINNPIDKINLMGSGTGSPQLLDVFRNNLRRRNFSKTLQKGGLYSRTGFNMPSYFNTSDAGTNSNVEYQSLGLLNMIYNYHKVINPLDLYEVSAFPYNLDVWTECWDLNSDNDMSGIAASSTFPIRGLTAITSGTCNHYVARDRTPEFYALVHDFIDSKIEAEANYLAIKNKFLLDVSSYLDASASLKSVLWNQYEFDLDEIYDIVLGKRVMSRGSKDGIQKLFLDYIKYFSSHGVGNSTIETIEDGGLNILAHTFGPLLYNAKFTVDGSGVNTGVSSQLINKNLQNIKSFAVKDISALNNKTASAVSLLPVQGTEYRNPHLLSGVEFVDSSAGTSKFTIIDLDPSTASRGSSNYLINNNIILSEPTGGLPRLRFSLKDYGKDTNLLIPEHAFEITLNAAIGTKDSNLLGGGAFGVWIHTAPEVDEHGNSGFWNYMPNGKWVYIPSSAVVSGTNATQYVKQNLIHTLDYSETYPANSEESCFLTKSDKDVLLNIAEEDFRATTISFNTFNQPIKTPLFYYKKFNKVHRSNQNYIFEIINLGTQINKYSIIDYISVKDSREADRAHLRHSFVYNNYDRAKEAMSDNFRFIDSRNNVVSSNTTLLSDSLGNVFTKNGEKVTFQQAQAFGFSQSKTVLYSQINLYDAAKWMTDANNIDILLNKIPYSGPFTVGIDSIIAPNNLTITGKTKGSNIRGSGVIQVPYTKKQVMGVLREFNRLQQDLGSRQFSISAPRFGPLGGSRLNYKVAPMWVQTSRYPNYLSNNNQYVELNVEN